MPNRNYQAGRRFEWEVQKYYEDGNYSTIRASGSHGKYDVVAFAPGLPVLFVQCKVVKTEKEAKRLLAKFVKETEHTDFYHQIMMVKVVRGQTFKQGV